MDEGGIQGRAGAAIVAAALPAVALAVDPWGWYPFGPVKWLVVSAMVPFGAALVVWRRRRPIAAVPTVAAAILVGCMALGAALGVDPLYAWTGTPERHFGVWAWALMALALVAGQQLRPERDGAALRAGLVVAGVGVGALATAEALGWEPQVFAVDARISATMGSPAYLGAVVALLLPASIGVAFDSGGTRVVRWGAGVAAGLLAVAGVGSGARASWFGLGAAAVVVAVVHRGSLRRRPGRTVLGVIGMFGAIALLLVVTPAGARLMAATDADAAGGRGRLDEWRVASRVVVAHPATGVGPEGYRVAFGGGADDDYERAHGRDPLPDRAHSAPLDVAATGGIPALVAWLVVVGALARSAVRSVGGRRAWLAGLGAGLVAHVAGQLLLFPTAELEPLAWLWGGLLLAATPDPVRTRPVPSVGHGAMTVVGVLAAVFGLAAGMTDLVADHHARAASSALTVTDTGLAVDEARAAVERRGDEVRLHVLLAAALVADQRGTAAAIATLDEAIGHSPGDPIVQRERAELLVQRAVATHLPVDVERARAETARLADGDPSNAALHLLAGTAARLAGDADRAEASFLRAEVLTTRDPVPALELARLLLDTGRRPEAEEALARAAARAPDDPRVAALRSLVDDAAVTAPR